MLIRGVMKSNFVANGVYELPNLERNLWFFAKELFAFGYKDFWETF